MICGATGPKKTIDEGIALLTTTNKVLEIRGIHATHGSCPGITRGYNADWYLVEETCTAANTCVIQPYQYTVPGTGDTVYLDGTKSPSSGWTRCTDCTAGVCLNVPAAACSSTWYATDSSSARRVVGASKDDDSPTYRVSVASDLTNSHANYNGKRCSTATWRACDYDHDCPGVETCTATSAEIDSYSGHADYNEMITFLQCQDKKNVKKLFLVHGEFAVQEFFSSKLTESGYEQIDIPELGEEVEV